MFEINDLVTGVTENHYCVTSAKALMLVTCVYEDGNIECLIIAHDDKDYLDEKYDGLEASYFRKVTVEEFLAEHPYCFTSDAFSNVVKELGIDITALPTEESAVMDMDQSFTIDDETRKALINEIVKLLEDYDYSVERLAIDMWLDNWLQNKGWLLNLFAKSPNYNGNFQILFDADYERKFYPDGVQRFREWIFDNWATENYDIKNRVFWFITPSVLGGNILTKELVNNINENFPDLNLRPGVGQKVSRLVNKLCVALGIDKVDGYNASFAAFADAINPMKIKRHTIISLHPVDYLTMSFGNSWASCHTIDKTNRRGMPGSYSGCYSSGTLSYMLDGSSFVFYTVESSYNGNEYELQPKVNRNMFHIGHDKLVQGRVYPKDYDGENGVYKQFREIIQKVVADCLDVPNLWSNTRGTSICSSNIYSKGTHYRDYENYKSCNVSWLKVEGKIKNSKRVEVGHNPICPKCGEEHTCEENILCEDCDGSKVECYRCGDMIDIEDAFWYEGEAYCRYCTEFCEYHQRREPKNMVNYYRGYGYACDDAELTKCEHCRVYYNPYESGFAAADGREFCCESCIEEEGYIYFEDDWYYQDEIRVCPECGETVFAFNYDDELEMCSACAEEEMEELNLLIDELKEAI